jgi:hypothetical protein
MAVTITLDDALVAGLENRAKKQQLSVEQLAIRILSEAMGESGSVTTAPAPAAQPSRVRPATANLAEVLRAAADDPSFDLEDWNRQWSTVEAELKTLTRANDVAEGRGR